MSLDFIFDPVARAYFKKYFSGKETEVGISDSPVDGLFFPAETDWEAFPTLLIDANAVLVSEHCPSISQLQKFGLWMLVPSLATAAVYQTIVDQDSEETPGFFVVTADSGSAVMYVFPEDFYDGEVVAINKGVYLQKPVFVSGVSSDALFLWASA